MEKHEFDLESIRLRAENGALEPIDFLLRADDALYTSVCRYKENAKDWWKWLQLHSENGNMTKKLIEYVYSGVDAVQKKREVQHILLSEPYNCDKPDGGFYDILRKDGKLLPNFRLCMDYMADLFQLQRIEIDENFKIIEGVAKRINFKESDYLELSALNRIDGEKVFSYAFVKSVSKEDSFSFTYFLK